MARRAVFGGTFKNALQVAGFAAGTLVRNTQHKASGTVVKVGPGLLRLNHTGSAQLQQHKYQQAPQEPAYRMDVFLDHLSFPCCCPIRLLTFFQLSTW